MKSKGIITAITILAMTAIALAPAFQALPSQDTRAGEIGWQYETFQQNIEVEVTPETITTLDQIVVTITSAVEDVWISQASLYGVVYPENGFQFPISFPFFKVDNDEITYRCIIEPFAQFSGYEIEFYIVAYDYFNTPMDSRSSNLYFTYSAVGSGWTHDSFEDNIELTYWPLHANATEEVKIILRSRENVTIQGANLWVTYKTPEGDVEEGGWNFSKTNANSTEMRQTIPGYPAGTNVTFWVIAWDKYNEQIVSEFYEYSVVGIMEYTDFPFEYSDTAGNKDVWIPDDVIILSMAGICALGIPLFIYLYAANIKREKHATRLVVKKAESVEKEPADEETEGAEEPAEGGGDDNE